MTTPSFFQVEKRGEPLAVTLKVAVCPSVTLTLAGCVVIVGATASAAVAMEPTENRVSNVAKRTRESRLGLTGLPTSPEFGDSLRRVKFMAVTDGHDSFLLKPAKVTCL
jgi:hypothetical protein